MGEIWLTGPSVAGGYWQRPELSAETFAARLEPTGEGPFLRTGDLGFVAGGRLFVTGRRKDLIILRGRNHYPQDLERTAETSHPAVRPGGTAAFSVEALGEERLGLAVEVERRAVRAAAELADVLSEVRRAVAEEHGAQVYEAVLLEPGAIPRTSSGKVRRSACRDALRAGALRVRAHSRGAESTV